VEENSVGKQSRKMVVEYSIGKCIWKMELEMFEFSIIKQHWKAVSENCVRKRYQYTTSEKAKELIKALEISFRKRCQKQLGLLLLEAASEKSSGKQH
jgi:hypothetical protein